MTFDLESKYVISLLNNLEDDIKIVIDASVPNKQQNRAAQKMSADYFFKTRDYIREYVENPPDLKKRLGREAPIEGEL